MSKTVDASDLVTIRKKGQPERVVTLGALIAESFDYDQDTGELSWKATPWVPSHRVGAFPTVTTACGYLTVKIAGKTLPAHRVAYVLMTGGFPPNGQVIDHINGNKTDNRWCNLRACTRAQNGQNALGLVPNNSSGFRGVYWDKRFSKWKANIRAFGKRYSLGSFDNKEDAIAARLEASARLHGPFAGRHT